MAQTIAVIGSTGQQGGSVVRACLKAGWRVRGITRKVDSSAAKALAAQGVEVAGADLDDEASLIKAFEGVQAIYAVTNFWEMIAIEGAHAGGKHEQQQCFNLAAAASETSTLKHYVFSTLPHTMKFSDGKIFVPHMEYKAQVDDYIRSTLPELAKKTTFLWIGWYPVNMASMPLIKPMEVPMSGKYIWVQPSAGKALLPISGDIPTNVGIFVAAILAHPEISLPGRYVTVKTETMSFEDILKVWSKVTGKEAEYVEIPFETYTRIWGPYGEEMAMQLKFGAEYGDWDTFQPSMMVKTEDLGIKRSDLKGLEETFELLKPTLT